MPGMYGLEIIKNVRKDNGSMEFIVLTMYDNEQYFKEAMELDIKGYLLKDNALSEVMNCLRNVSQGRHYICPTISDYLVAYKSCKEKLSQ